MVDNLFKYFFKYSCFILFFVLFLQGENIIVF